jgi:hypothetical protein
MVLLHAVLGTKVLFNLSSLNRTALQFIPSHVHQPVHPGRTVRLTMSDQPNNPRRHLAALADEPAIVGDRTRDPPSNRLARMRPEVCVEGFQKGSHGLTQHWFRQGPFNRRERNTPCPSNPQRAFSAFDGVHLGQHGGDDTRISILCQGESSQFCVCG